MSDEIVYPLMRAHGRLAASGAGVVVRPAFFMVSMIVFCCAVSLPAQDPVQEHGAPTPLSDAVAEAENNNSLIAAAGHAWSASAHIAQQVRAQAASQAPVLDGHAGTRNSPAKPSNSDPAKMEMGAPQKPAHPGELQQWSEAAKREAETQHAQVDVFRSNIADQVKTIYLRLAYLYQMYDLDDRGAADLAALIQTEVSKYSLGIGSQADVLRAQLERTKLLRETTLQHEEVGGLQANLKALLHRLPDSPDIIPERVAVTHLKLGAGELLAMASEQNPTLIADGRMIEAQSAQLDAVKADTRSEFNLGYTFPQTGESYRDGYVLTLNRQLPRGPGEDDRIAAAVERVESSNSQASEDRLRQLAEVQKQFVIVASAEELMRECNEGLVPQSKAIFQSKLAGYQSDREKFSAVIEAFLDELIFEDDYLQALLDHETALAHLETLTGGKLR